MEAKWVFEKILEATKSGTLKWNPMASGRGLTCGFIQSKNKYHISFVEDAIYIWDSTEAQYQVKVGTITLSDADAARLDMYITGKEKATELTYADDNKIHYFYRDLFNKNR